MATLRVLIMAMTLLMGAIGTGRIGPNRSAVREAFALSETGYAGGIAVIQIGVALAVMALCLFVMGGLFSSTWPSFYAQAAVWLRDHRDVLPCASGLGNVLGISLCVFAAGVIADRSMTAALVFGPCVLGAFGLLYLGRGLYGRARGEAAA